MATTIQHKSGCHEPVCECAWKRIMQLEAGLRRIADAESGHWGWIAHGALHPERAQSSENHRPLEGE